MLGSIYQRHAGVSQCVTLAPTNLCMVFSKPAVWKNHESDRSLHEKMKSNIGNTGFWKGGFSSFQDSLAVKEKELLDPLVAELELTTDVSRRLVLKNQIKTIKDDFKTKRRNAKYSLFGNR